MNSVHQLDAVRFVTGLSFVRAQAAVATMHADVEVEDTAAAVLRPLERCDRKPRRRRAQSGRVDDERIELDGTEGRLDLPDATGDGQPGLRLFLRRRCEELPARKWVELGVDESDAFLELLRSFVQAVAEGGEPPASAADAAAALATVLAIYESAETGRRAEVAA